MSRAHLRVVVVGGGFGGLYAAAYLGRSELGERGAEITLVDRRNHFTFTPLLAEVAAGLLGREHVTVPYRVLARRHGFGFVLDEARGLDPKGKTLVTANARLPYDYLVLAPGAEPQYFGNDALRRASLPFTTVDDALAVRGRVIHCLERAVLIRDGEERRRLLTFVVGAAGPEGSENRFAVGDATTLVDPRSPRPYPRVAPIAISQGVRAAANIENHALGRPLEPYQATHAGKIVSLGDGVALVEILGVPFTGPLAWWLYRVTYLFKLVGTKNKIRVLVALGLNRFFGPDLTYDNLGAVPLTATVGGS